MREAFNRVLFGEYNPPKRNILTAEIGETGVEGQLKLSVTASEPTFGPQPFLAVETNDGRFHHDNFDFQEPFRKWSYIFDEHTFPPRTIRNIGVGTNDRKGFYYVLNLNM